MNNFLIVANFKMNPAPEGWCNAGSPYLPRNSVDVVVFPSLPDIEHSVRAKLNTGAQYGRAEDKGAFTGDISMNMINKLGCKYVICGHSERRQYHGETDEDVAAQVMSAIEHNLHPIICIGETVEERNAGQAKEVITRQLEAISKLQAPSSKLPLGHELEAEWQAHSFSIAYEPVWAIGTGETATPEMAQEMHAFIREKFCILFSLSEAEGHSAFCILYGGSMNPENAADLLSQPDINGGLIGGASLVPSSFSEIIEIAGNLQRNAE
ncbi:MAG: triose-phosphate isomerase [Candidatus Peribacteraceae bacterium]|nr:triose-phosphate isomerase [Candidatus Peribacteraceae bacterium]